MPQSSTAFHEPSACCRHTLMYSPCASGFFCVESLLQAHGPVLQPSLRSALIAACMGVHASRPCQPARSFSYVLVPLTGPGRNTTLVGASQARNPSRTPAVRTCAANPRSAATMGAASASADVVGGGRSTGATDRHISTARRLEGTRPPDMRWGGPAGVLGRSLELADSREVDEWCRARRGELPTSARGHPRSAASDHVDMTGPRMHRAMVNLYTTLRPQAGPGRLPKTTYQVVVRFRACPGYPNARLFNEPRPTTEGALQSALAPSLGAERARDEAGSLAGQMADAFQNGGLAGFVPELSRRVANWQAAGVPEAAV